MPALMVFRVLFCEASANGDVCFYHFQSFFTFSIRTFKSPKSVCALAFCHHLGRVDKKCRRCGTMRWKHKTHHLMNHFLNWLLLVNISLSICLLSVWVFCFPPFRSRFTAMSASDIRVDERHFLNNGKISTDMVNRERRKNPYHEAFECVPRNMVCPLCRSGFS